jgi:hypothetical protein
VGVYSAAKLISLNNTVGGDCHQFVVRNLELSVELNESLMLPALLETETAATKEKTTILPVRGRPNR